MVKTLRNLHLKWAANLLDSSLRLTNHRSAWRLQPLCLNCRTVLWLVKFVGRVHRQPMITSILIFRVVEVNKINELCNLNIRYCKQATLHFLICYTATTLFYNATVIIMKIPTQALWSGWSICKFDVCNRTKIANNLATVYSYYFILYFVLVLHYYYYYMTTLEAVNISFSRKHFHH